MQQHDERSVGQLVASLGQDVSTLVRGELELAKAEIRESATQAAKGAGYFGAAGFLAYVAFLMLSVSAAFGLVAAGLHPALGFLIVAAVFLLVAGVLALIGRRDMKRVGPPKRAMDEFEQTRGALQHLPSSASSASSASSQAVPTQAAPTQPTTSPTVSSAASSRATSAPSASTPSR